MPESKKTETAPIAKAGATLFNHETQKPEYVAAEDVAAALKSGTYSENGAVASHAGGGTVYRNATELPTAAIQGETIATDVTAAKQADDFKAVQKEALRTKGDKALTFADGVADSLTLGMANGTELADGAVLGGALGLSSDADVRQADSNPSGRREANPGYHTAGELTGLAIAAATPAGPGLLVSKTAAAGTKAGRAAAKMILGEQRVAAVLKARELTQLAKAGGGAAKLAAQGAENEVGAIARIGVRVGEESGAGGALAGAMAFNHQLHDAIMEDKPFVGEAILHDIGMGVILGGGIGLAHGTAGSLLSRAGRRDVVAQSGLLDSESTMSKGVHDNIRSGVEGMHDALEAHDVRMGVIQHLEEGGYVPRKFIEERQALVNQAKAAKNKLAGLDMDAALSGTDDKAYLKWRDAMEDYQDKIVKLDGAMQQRFVERAGYQPGGQSPLKIGQGPEPMGPLGNTEVRAAANGEVSPMSFGLDEAMARMPGAADKYEAIYGRKFQPMEEVLGGSGEALEGGQLSATSEEGTTAGKVKARKPIETPVEEAAPSGPRTQQGVAEGERPPNVGGRPVVPGAEVEEFTARAPGKGLPLIGDTYAGSAAGPRPPMPWKPLAPAGEFNPNEFTEGERNAEFGVGRDLKRRVNNAPMQGDHLNNMYGAKELRLLPDGSMMPARDAQAVADAFAQFRQKAADTSVLEAAPARGTAARPVAAEQPIGERTALGKAKTEQAPAVEGRMGPPTSLQNAEAPRFNAKSTGRQAVERFMDQWYNEANQYGPRVTPADRAAARLGGLMDQIKQATGGALDSAGAAEAMAGIGVRPASSSFGSQIDQLVAARKLGRAAADASRGLKTEASKGIMRWAGRKIGGRIAASAVGGAIGGPVGYVLGAAWGDKLFGFAGKASGAAGRIVLQTAKVVDSLLSGTRGTMLGQASRVTKDPAANNPVAYSDEGPIKDPIQRILEVQKIASNPDALRAYVVRQMGDLALLHPEVTGSAADLVKQRIIGLSMRAPAVYFDQLGNPMGPSSQAMRRWLELENATHNLDAVLEAVGAGTATEQQIDALRTMHPGVHQRLIQGVLSDPDRLKELDRTELKRIQNVLGIPLTTSGQSSFVARQQEAWRVHEQTSKQFDPGAVTPPAPTPAQAGDTAPGNR